MERTSSRRTSQTGEELFWPGLYKIINVNDAAAAAAADDDDGFIVFAIKVKYFVVHLNTYMQQT